ncbi:Transcriptional regulator PadR-like family protein [compost metagenome]
MTRFVVLSFLRMKEMHGYEIQNLIQMSKIEQWANLLSGSLYHALNNLEKEGKIETSREERTGARIRKIYRITEEGEKEFQAELRKGLLTPPGSTKSDFALAVSWVSVLPKEEAKALLTQNIEQIEQNIANWEYGKQVKGRDSQLAELSMEHGIQKMKLDVDYLNKVIALL